MFSVAISQPSVNFDGKHGIIFHGTRTVAQRNSINRPAGTAILKPKNVDSLEFIDGQTGNDGMLDQIMQRGGLVEDYSTIQVDGASAHTGNQAMQRLNQYCDDNDIHLEYIRQPPNSPDLNICDLSIFYAMEKQVHRIKRRGHGTIQGLADATTQVYNDFSRDTIEIAYGHQWAVFNEILRTEGSNDFKSPHAHVRTRYAAGEALNTCNVTLTRYNELRAQVNDYFHIHDKNDPDDPEQLDPQDFLPLMKK
jgi:hypothetical protein